MSTNGTRERFVLAAFLPSFNYAVLLSAIDEFRYNVDNVAYSYGTLKTLF